MDVILMARLANLGDLGDEVSVKSGYARNFLFPQGKAVRATAANREVFETRRAELEAVAKAELGGAEGRAAGLEGQVLTLIVKAGEEGKLYGSVGTQEIADGLTAMGQEVHKAEVMMPEGVIRTLGSYEIAIMLHSDVSAQVTVNVVEE
ncbi:MAG: 50S ribosomal protein L9 [Pseudomonadaceae bacterium]|nr:50S ribosomal protein L9 [Pseudomonadaceae bacterium]